MAHELFVDDTLGEILSELHTANLSDLQKRLLARQAPPDHVVEDTERFHVENTISDLMIEVEMLRTEIEMLTQNRSGGRR